MDSRSSVGGSPTLREATLVWARIGILSFGGPAGQIALMHRELVEERKWISDGRFLHALNYCMLLPGPEAQQLAVYIGWLMHRTRGALIAGGLFVFPGFLTILLLSVIYARYGQVPWINAVFFGLKAAVLAIVLEAVIRIGKRALRTRVMVLFAVAAFVAIYALHLPFPAIVAGAALLGLVIERINPRLMPPPLLRKGEENTSYIIDRMIDEGGLTHIQPRTARTLRTAALWLAIWAAPVVVSFAVVGEDHVFTQLGMFFSKAAVVTFGGAYSVLAYIAQQAVEVHGWLSPAEMLDGLALAETTPGPLIMVVQFVGYLASFRFDAGLSPVQSAVIGSVITTWVTFAPCFLWIAVGAPYVERLIGNRWLHAALSSITAAVVGVILNLSVWFAAHTLFGQVEEVVYGPARLLIPVFASLDAAALLIFIASAVALVRFHVGIAKTLAATAAAGLLWRLVLS